MNIGPQKNEWLSFDTQEIILRKGTLSNLSVYQGKLTYSLV